MHTLALNVSRFRLFEPYSEGYNCGRGFDLRIPGRNIIHTDSNDVDEREKHAARIKNPRDGSTIVSNCGRRFDPSLTFEFLVAASYMRTRAP